MFGNCIICQEYKKLSYITNCKYVSQLPNNICSDCVFLYKLNNCDEIGFEIICCNDCIIHSGICNRGQVQNYTHYMIDDIHIYRHNIKLNHSTFLLYAVSFIDIFGEQNKIIELLKRKIRRRLTDFLI